MSRATKNRIKEALETALLSALEARVDEDGNPVPVDPRVLNVARQYVADIKDDLPDKSEIERVLEQNQDKLPFPKVNLG